MYWFATHGAPPPQSIYTRAPMVFTINANCILFHAFTSSAAYRPHVVALAP
ncbi:hypothetical protein AX27061_0715 [Achromobacter xylosoxidans NBRC 15126 = ATCC 27061]|nr:hypothetical protein AX27061_0715 [Achromobacter xylosoxidans NBRC 15126 = ATCC 27061]